MISLLKREETEEGKPGLKLAICICMYSEDKAMLKKTLAGVQENIAAFEKKGVSSHEIAVFVIMDGI